MNQSIADNHRMLVTVVAAAMGVLVGCGLAKRPVSPAAPQPTAGPQPTRVGIPFQVVDEEGKILLEVRKAGNRPLLSLNNSKGKMAVGLTTITDAGAVFLNGTKGNTVVIMWGQDGGQLMLYPDKRSGGFVDLGVGRHGGYAKLRSVKGTDMISLDVEKDGGRIQVRNASGKVTGQ